MLANGVSKYLAILGYGIHLYLLGMLYELGDNHRVVFAHIGRQLEELAELALVGTYVHSRTRQYVRRTHEHWEAHTLYKLIDIFHAGERTPLGLVDSMLRKHGRELGTVLCIVDILGRSAQNRHIFSVKPHRKVVRNLSTRRDYHTMRILQFDDIEHALKREFIEIEPIAHIIVRGHCLRIIIDHDRTVTLLANRVERLHAAPVKLYRTADTVCARTKDYDRTLIVRESDVGANSCISNIQIIGLSRILCRQSVNLLHNGHDAIILAQAPQHHSSLVHVANLALQSNGAGYLEICKTINLGRTKQFLVQCVDIVCLQLLININNMLQLLQEPLVYLGQLMDLVYRITLVHSLRDDKDALVGWLAQGGIDIGNLQLLVFYKSVHALPYHTQAFLDSFLKIAANSHYLAHRFHAGAQFLIHTAELREIPAGNLADHVVQGRLEESTGSLGYRILEFEQAIAHTQFGSHKGQRITRSLGCERRGPAQTGIHLNDTVILAYRVKRILHITLADDSNMADNLNRQSAEFVILAVGQCLGRSYHYRLTRVDAQGVEVFHVTDRDTVVVPVSHHLVFYLFPALETLLHQHLWREREGFLRQLVQFFLIIGKSAAQSAQCVCGTDDNRITQFGSSLTHLLYILTGLAADGLDINLLEFLNKQFTVFRVHDGLYRSTQHLDVVFLEHATLIQLHTTVEGCLSSKTEQDSVWTLLLNDALHKIGLYWQEINLVCDTLGSLHCSNIGIDKHRGDTFLAQRLQRLRPRIVKLACLAYLQCAGTQQQYFLYTFILHDVLPYFNVSTNLSNMNSVSTGPEQASGWNWLLNQGLVLCLIPSLEPSFMFTNNSSQSAPNVLALTAYP